jgi:hypothetical protein
LFAGTDRGVFLSANSGLKWTEVDTDGTFSKLAVRSLAKNEDYLFAGTYYGSVWRRPLSDFNVIVRKTVHRVSKNTDVRISLTGTIGSNVSIEFVLPRRELTTITLCNISGCVIRSLTNQLFNPGSHKLSWNSVNLLPGCYILNVQTATSCSVKNFILAK